MLDEKIYHMTCVAQQITGIAQQVATVGQQGRSELATLRYMYTLVLQKYRGCSDAYKTLYGRHKATAAELERLKSQKVQESTLSEVRDVEKFTQLQMEIALVEKEVQELLQEKANVEEGYRQALINAENRIQSQEEELKSLRTGENADLESPLLPVTNVQSPKRERETDELQQEEGPTKSRKRKAKQQK